MLSFRMLMHLFASFFLISSVSLKKYLVETEDFDPNVPIAKEILGEHRKILKLQETGSKDYKDKAASPQEQGCVDRDGQEVEEGKWIKIDPCNSCTCLHGRRQADMKAMFDDVEELLRSYFHCDVGFYCTKCRI